MGLLDYAIALTKPARRKVMGLLAPDLQAGFDNSARVINEGLLNPNQYNKRSADRFKDSAFGLAGIVPGVGDVAAIPEAVDLFKRGENVAGGMSALGALPLVPAIGGMFIGKGAKTWDALKAQQAEEMLAKGVDPREVWKQTGTFRGVDNALRQEIPDNAAQMSGFEPTDEIIAAYNEGGKEAMLARKAELAGYERPYRRTSTQDIDNVFSHSQLADAYPDLFHYGKYQYDYANPVIGEGAYYANKPDAKYAYDLIKLSPANEPTARSGMLHELQHAIQQREGWARGGSPEQMAVEFSRAVQAQDYYSTLDALTRTAVQDFGGSLDKAAKELNAIGIEVTQEHIDDVMRLGESAVSKKAKEAQDALKSLGGAGRYGDPGHNLYKRLAGEAEARLTQARMNMTMPERLQSYPLDMMDVPPEQQIIRGLLDGPAMSYADEAKKAKKVKR